jgi:hypothetical protein
VDALNAHQGSWPRPDIRGAIHVHESRAAAHLHAYVSRRLRSALRPFADRVSRVTVRVVDVNGPKGGVDTRCSIAVNLHSGRRVFVRAISNWPHAAVSLAARRLTRILGRVAKTTHAHGPSRPAGTQRAASDSGPDGLTTATAMDAGPGGG